MADGRHLEKLKNGHISASVRFRAMTLPPLHLVVNWPVFTIYVIKLLTGSIVRSA